MLVSDLGAHVHVFIIGIVGIGKRLNREVPLYHYTKQSVFPPGSNTL